MKAKERAHGKIVINKIGEVSLDSLEGFSLVDLLGGYDGKMVDLSAWIADIETLDSAYSPTFEEISNLSVRIHVKSYLTCLHGEEGKSSIISHSDSWDFLNQIRLSAGNYLAIEIEEIQP